MSAEDYDALEKLKSLETIVASLRMGIIEEFKCPYCGLINNEAVKPCCQKLEIAVNAVCDRLQMNENLETLDRIAQKVN